ncbi:MAG: oligosaccharide flippase family protein [Alphaproteobacteria bacterium]|nr:oligosaccharide flippase family protein [Alphaproteobacteria bacterium]
MSVRRSLAWMMGSQGTLLVMQFGGSVALARLLTPYEMGVYAVGSAMVNIISVVQAFGLALFVIREKTLEPELQASVFTVNAILAVLLSAVVVALSAFGGAFLREPGVERVMLVLAVVPLIGALEFLPAAKLERAAQFRAVAMVGLLRMAASTLATVALAWWGFSFMSIAWGGVAGAVASATGFLIAGRQHVSFRLGFTAWRRLLRFGVHQMAIHGVNTAANRLSDLILGRMLGLAALGLYGRASNLSALLWFNILVAVGRVVMVDFADRQRRGEGLRESYLRSSEILLGFLWPAYAGLAIVSAPFIRVIYGSAWVGAAAPLACLSIGAMLSVSITMAWEVFVVCNETERQARIEFRRSGFGLVLFAIGSLFSLTAAAAARIGEALFSVALYRPHIERLTGTRRSDFTPIYRRCTIATVAACGPAFLLMLAYDFSAQTPLLLVIGAVVLGLALWLVALLCTGHALAGEIGRFAAKARAALSTIRHRHVPPPLAG